MPVLKQHSSAQLFCNVSPPRRDWMRLDEIGWLAHYFCLYCKDDHRGLTTATSHDFWRSWSFQENPWWAMAGTFGISKGDDMVLRADPCGYSDDVITHVQRCPSFQVSHHAAVCWVFHVCSIVHLCLHQVQPLLTVAAWWSREFELWAWRRAWWCLWVLFGLRTLLLGSASWRSFGSMD